MRCSCQREYCLRENTGSIHSEMVQVVHIAKVWGAMVLLFPDPQGWKVLAFIVSFFIISHEAYHLWASSRWQCWTLCMIRMEVSFPVKIGSRILQRVKEEKEGCSGTAKMLQYWNLLGTSRSQSSPKYSYTRRPHFTLSSNLQISESWLNLSTKHQKNSFHYPTAKTPKTAITAGHQPRACNQQQSQTRN